MNAESREIEERQPLLEGGSASPSLPSVLEQARSRSPARILTGRSGAAYRTATWLKLRGDHALARDAVFTEFDLVGDLGEAFVARWGLFEVATLARTKSDYLLRPDLGRSLSVTAKVELERRCPAGADLHVAIADGLSARAVQTQVPALLPLLSFEARNTRLEVRPAIPECVTRGWECSTRLAKSSIRLSSYS